MSSIRVLDLFSGIGGFSHGFENAGDFETVAFCEIDPHAQKVLKKHWPEVPIIEDVRKIKGEDFKDVDVICGGFPCQDISVAGKQKGITNETRSGLWIEYKRIIQEINPRWVVIENVRNLLSNGLAIVLQDLHEIGYDAEWEIISARSVGACHLRERAWIIAYPKSLGIQGLRTSGEQESYSHGEETVSLRSSEVEPTSTSDSSSFGLIQCPGQSKEIQSRGNSGFQREKREQPSMSKSLYSINEIQLADSDYFRFWPAFTSEEEKCEWWAKATSGIRDWWEVESSVCRVDDGLSSGLDKGRAQRIKQLGNSIVPQIAQIIGDRILFHESVDCL